jgi:hypothetical protein
MKRFGATIIILLIAVGFLMIACSSEQKPTAEKAKVESLATTPADIKKEAKDLAKVTMTYSAEQMEQYKQKISEKMAQYQTKQNQIKSKLATMSEQTKAGLDSQMENLKTKKAKVDAIILELHTSSGEAFENLKEGMDNAMEDMDKAYDQAMDKFKK